MPSSTSDSSSRIPHSPHTISLITTAILFFAICAAANTFFKSQGFPLNVADNKLFWSTKREHIYKKNTLVILGSSRAQMGIDPEILKQNFHNHNVVNLAIAATTPYAILEHLSNDINFNGTILLETTAPNLIPQYDTPPSTSFADYYNTQYPEMTPSQIVDSKISSYLQTQFTFLSSDITPKTVIASRGFLIRKGGMLYSRHRPCSFPKIKNARLSQNQFAKIKPIDNQKFCQKLKTNLNKIHKKLKDNGAKIILVRMPSTHTSWQNENAKAPKANYWDNISTLTKIPTIHFQDYPQLTHFKCPDGSHLDAKDAPIFTEALSKIIKEKFSNTQDQ